MALPRAEKFIALARQGHKLNATDRRAVIAYLMITKPEVGASDMAELFKVSIRQIYLDRTELRKLRANSIKQEDPALVLADISISFDQQIRDMEASKAKCKLGSSVYLAHCKTIFNTQIQKVEALQSLGYYPKNLGNLVTERYEWKADVTKDGTVHTRPVHMQFSKTNSKTDITVDYEDLTAPPAALEPAGDEMESAILTMQEGPSETHQELVEP